MCVDIKTRKSFTTVYPARSRWRLHEGFGHPGRRSLAGSGPAVGFVERARPRTKRTRLEDGGPAQRHAGAGNCPRPQLRAERRWLEMRAGTGHRGGQLDGVKYRQSSVNTTGVRMDCGGISHRAEYRKAKCICRQCQSSAPHPQATAFRFHVTND